MFLSLLLHSAGFIYHLFLLPFALSASFRAPYEVQGVIENLVNTYLYSVHSLSIRSCRKACARVFHSVCVMMLINQDRLAAQCVMALASSQHGANYVRAESVLVLSPSFYSDSLKLTCKLKNKSEYPSHFFCHCETPGLTLLLFILSVDATRLSAVTLQSNQPYRRLQCRRITLLNLC